VHYIDGEEVIIGFFFIQHAFLLVWQQGIPQNNAELVNAWALCTFCHAPEAKEK